LTRLWCAARFQSRFRTEKLSLASNGNPTNVNAEVLTHQYHISGQAVVRIAESDLYFGPHDSAESIGRHAVLVDIY